MVLRRSTTLIKESAHKSFVAVNPASLCGSGFLYSQTITADSRGYDLDL
jgi:hypothetical protein